MTTAFQDAMQRADDFRHAMRDAVRQHCNRTQAPEGHYDACLADVRREPRESWPWFLAYFKGEIA